MPRAHVAAALLCGLVLATPAPAGARGTFCQLLPCPSVPVTRRVLPRDQVIDGIACRRREEAGVDPTGRLVFCTTARAQTISGLPIAARAYTIVYPGGGLDQSDLARRHDLTLPNGVLVRCGPGLIALSETGGLRSCTLGARRTHGVPARVGEGIAFHPSGWLAGATVDVPWTVHGVTVPAGTWLAWDASGRAVRALLEGQVVVAGMTVGYELTWYPSGAPRSVTLAAPARRAGHDLPAFAKLELRADGTLARAVYVEDYDTMPHGELITETRTLTFDAREALTSSTLDVHQSDVRPPHR